jgi:hypothetical protein
MNTHINKVLPRMYRYLCISLMKKSQMAATESINPEHLLKTYSHTKKLCQKTGRSKTGHRYYSYLQSLRS